MSIDTVGDFLTVLRNGIMVYKRAVSVPYSKMKAEIARVLKEEGFIKDFKKEALEDDTTKARLVVYLKYVDGESVVHEIKRISKPGCRIYQRVVDTKPRLGGLGLAILTTNKGIVSDRIARQQNIGGEVLCHVW